MVNVVFLHCIEMFAVMGSVYYLHDVICGFHGVLIILHVEQRNNNNDDDDDDDNNNNDNDDDNNNNNNNDDDNDNNNNKGLKNGKGICLHPLQGHEMQIYSLSMLKTTHVL